MSFSGHRLTEVEGPLAGRGDPDRLSEEVDREELPRGADEVVERDVRAVTQTGALDEIAGDETPQHRLGQLLQEMLEAQHDSIRNRKRDPDRLARCAWPALPPQS